MEQINHRNAVGLVERAVAEALAIQSPSSIAVVDSGRNLVAFARMDGAPLASIDICIGKAYTARSLNMSTADLGDLVQPGQPLFGIALANRTAPLVTFGGGVPIKLDGEVVGAIGVAGGTPEQDTEVAQKTLATWDANAQEVIE